MVNPNDPDVEIDENGNVVGGGTVMPFDLATPAEIEAAKNRARERDGDDDEQSAEADATDEAGEDASDRIGTDEP